MIQLSRQQRISRVGKLSNIFHAPREGTPSAEGRAKGEKNVRLFRTQKLEAKWGARILRGVQDAFG